MTSYNQNTIYPQAYQNDFMTPPALSKSNIVNSNVPNHYTQAPFINQSNQFGNIDTTGHLQTSNSYVNPYPPHVTNQVPPNSAFQTYPPTVFSPPNVGMNSESNISPPMISDYQNQYSSIPQNSNISDKFQTMQITNTYQEKTVDLMQKRDLFTDTCNTDFPPGPRTHFPANCDPKIMQCTLNTLPIESTMLVKSRLPLGVHIQPFRDSDIVTVSTNSIVRCRPCRTYINPFVTLTENQRRWHCNVCGKVNDIPDEFMYDPITKCYGNPSQRPELKFCNIEYTANPEYTVRPPMSTMYVFLLDVSKAAISSGYLRHTCNIIKENLSKIPGDRRAQIAFFTYNSFLHYYQIQENSYKMVIWPDIDEVEVPFSEDLLVNLHERSDIIMEFLENLPSNFVLSNDSGNCLGFAIQVSMKLIGHNGGRVTIINASLPSVGPGQLKPREYKDGDVSTLQPATDFYKSLALQCANDQISVDLFCINRQYSDIASLSAITRHSSGCFQYYGNFKAISDDGKPLESEEQLDFDRFTRDFRRYLTRKIGFEAVMRTRFTKGLDLTAFHGNLFMRSTNVIALPVVNPDNSYLIQFKINSSMSDWSYAIIQSALLYTTSESDRRIRVHTMCLPISGKLEDLFYNANGPAITGLITKIAVDKCIATGFNNVREAFVNSLVDPLKVFNSLLMQSCTRKALLCPISMRYLAPFVLGLLRNPAFRPTPMSTDDRIAMFESLRSLPLTDVLHRVYPYLVSVQQLAEEIPLNQLAASNGADGSNDGDSGIARPEDTFDYPTRLHLTSGTIRRDGAFLMDTGSCFYLFLGVGVTSHFLRSCFAINDISQLPRNGLVTNLDLDNAVSRRLLAVKRAIARRAVGASVITVLPDSRIRNRVLNYLVEDRMENSMSYIEFLKSIQSSVYS